MTNPPAISILDFFRIGIGPSSSHTVGPMCAAVRFLDDLRNHEKLDLVARVEIQLFGSLALTGKGHGTDKAVLLGLEGEMPESVDIDSIPARLDHIRKDQSLRLAGQRVIPFDETNDLLFQRRKSLPGHPNALQFRAFNTGGEEIASEIYYSLGGGFILCEAEMTGNAGSLPQHQDLSTLPFPYAKGADLLRMGSESGLSVSEMTLRNEGTWRKESETTQRLVEIWRAMHASIERGCQTDGVLPGGLKVVRRAPGIFRDLKERERAGIADPLDSLDWVSLWAMAVNEENAAGGRVVTAPTNGAAGIIPAVLKYFVQSQNVKDDARIAKFLLTAGAIALLYKRNASISGAEVGCQGEVGVACSMAAGALCESLGGTVAQVENAAEIGMEHNLGLTCDPIGGLVQVPCIERNAMGAVKAIQAARLALHGDGQHRVSLDKVIATMRQTGKDMSKKYKETARGGLAVNLPEC